MLLLLSTSDDGQGSPPRRGTNRTQSAQNEVQNVPWMSKVEVTRGQMHPMPMVTFRLR